MILSHTLTLSVSQLETQQLMNSQIRSHIEYFLQTYNTVVLILYSKLMKHLALLTVYNKDFLMFLMSILNTGLLFGPPCI